MARSSAHAGRDQRRRLSGGSRAVLVSGLFGLPGLETVPGGAIATRSAAAGCGAAVWSWGGWSRSISIVEWSIAACVYPISLRLVHARTAGLRDAPLFLFAAVVRTGGGGLSVFRGDVFFAALAVPGLPVGRLRGGRGRRCPSCGKAQRRIPSTWWWPPWGRSWRLPH